MTIFIQFILFWQYKLAQLLKNIINIPLLLPQTL